MTVSVTNVNEGPLAVSDTATAIEAGGVSNGAAGTNPSGNVLTNDTDVDAGDSKTVSGVAAGVAGSASTNVGSAVTGSYGSINIAADGSYTYSVDNTNAAVQALRTSSNTLQDVFTYTMRDTAGLTSTTQITVTIQGANDAPTITSNGGGTTAAITLAENLTTVSTVVGNDVDSGTTLTYSILGGADAARFSINSATGALIFVIAPDFENPTDVGGNNVYDVVIQVSDGSLATTQSLAVTITDVSNFLFVTTATDNNDSGITTGASYTIEWLNANKGADSAVSLREAILAANNTAGVDTINFNIAGTGIQTINLASALPSITDGLVINGYSQAGATVNSATVGNNAVLNIVLSGTGAGASASGLTLAAGSGGSTIQGLVIENFAQSGISVSSAGNTIVGNFIGVGANGATPAGNGYGIFVTGGSGNTIGGTTAASTNIIAFNGGDGVSITGSVTGTSILGNAIYGNNGLAIDLGDDGTTINDGALTVGQPNQLMDTPVLTNANLVGTNLVLAGYVGSAANQVSFANSRVEFYKTTATSSVYLGALTTDANGNFNGTLDVTGLGLSQSDAVTATATSNSGNTSEFSVIFAANAAPTANADSNGAVEAGGTLNGSAGVNPTGNVLTNDTDPNASDTKTVSGVAAGSVASAAGSVGASVTGLYGSIQIAANGSYTYTVDNSNSAVQALRTSGQTLTDIFTYTMSDSGGLTSTTQVTITIQGANDAPVGVADFGNAVEAGGLAGSTAGSDAVGNVLANDTDVDAGDTKTVSGVAAGTVTSTSGSVGSSVTGMYGSITMGSNGAYTYVVDNSNASVQALRTSGQSISDVFSYTVIDTAGLTSTTQLTITITGANDTPTAVSDAVIAVEAGGTNNGSAGTNPIGNVLANDTDVDAVAGGETKTVSGAAAGTVASASGSVGASITGTYGSIVIAADGSYNYTVDNTNASVQALRTSAHTLDDVFTYTMTDAGGLTSTAQITVTIRGANDAPVAANDFGNAIEAGGVANGTPGSNATGNVLSNDTDVDVGDTQAVSGVVAGVHATASGSVATSVTGTYGAITIASDGSYTYTVDDSNALVQALRTSGETLSDVFTYAVIDAAGLTHTAQLTITIGGANDAPTPAADNPVAVESGGLNNGNYRRSSDWKLANQRWRC